MFNERVPLLKAALVEQDFKTLARCQLAAIVLGINALLTTAESRSLTLLFEFFDNLFHDARRSLIFCRTS